MSSTIISISYLFQVLDIGYWTFWTKQITVIAISITIQFIGSVSDSVPFATLKTLTCNFEHVLRSEPIYPLFQNKSPEGRDRAPISQRHRLRNSTKAEREWHCLRKWRVVKPFVHLLLKRFLPTETSYPESDSTWTESPVKAPSRADGTGPETGSIRGLLNLSNEMKNTPNSGDLWPPRAQDMTIETAEKIIPVTFCNAIAWIMDVGEKIMRLPTHSWKYLNRRIICVFCRSRKICARKKPRPKHYCLSVALNTWLERLASSTYSTVWVTAAQYWPYQH